MSQKLDLCKTADNKKGISGHYCFCTSDMCNSFPQQSGSSLTTVLPSQQEPTATSKTIIPTVEEVAGEYACLSTVDKFIFSIFVSSLARFLLNHG